jgi:hypothetical protein
MEDIVVTSAINFKTYLHISLRRVFKLPFIILLCVVFASTELELFKRPVFDWGDQLFILGCFLFFFVLIPTSIYLAAKKGIKKITVLNETIVYTINEDTIKVDSETISGSRTWKYANQLIERKNYFLLSMEFNLFYCLPKDGFQSKEDIQKLKVIAYKKGLRYLQE